MIIFYNKQTGNIVGTIDGRIHNEDHLKMWIGEAKETERIICNWKAVKYFNKDGKKVTQGSTETPAADFEPEHSQKQLFIDLDKKPSLIYDYRVDLKTKRLVKK